MTLSDAVEQYLRVKRRRLAESSHDAYERCLRELLAHFPGDPTTEILEPPAGTAALEDFLAVRWGESSPRTFNKNLAILRGLCGHMARRGQLRADPTALIERSRVEQSQRATFTDSERAAVLAAAGPRDRVALRLLLDYGLRKGALQAVRGRHFDPVRRRLTIFTKGGKVRELPLGEPIWRELAAASVAENEYLLHRRGHADRPMSGHGLHKWWYHRLGEARVVEPGTTSGRKMHGARHTAGQRVLDRTGNLKSVQVLLGHASISTTGDVYSDWSAEQLEATMRDVLGEPAGEGDGQ